ncbi:MAG: attachment glycoprotein G [Clostridia bacterium]|nr:attachment glycoprotein G [Clostridia bacterium]
MKNMKKGLAGILVAILLVIGYFTGVIPTDGDNAEMDISSVISQTITDEADDKATDVPTEAPTEKPTKAPTEKPTKAPTATPTAKPTKAPTKAPTEAPTEAPRKKAGPITEPQDIVDYLYEHGELPDNFITKKEAQALGWDSNENYVGDVAPGKSIGGDRFGNYEGLLPKAKGRTYYEADCYYEGRKRNACRVVYSNDGLYFYTDDHYETFTEMKPTGK